MRGPEVLTLENLLAMQRVGVDRNPLLLQSAIWYARQMARVDAANEPQMDEPRRRPADAMIDPRNPPYIVVSNINGPSTNPRRHSSRDSAQREARRLAIENPDDMFLIFRAVAAVEAPRVTVTEFDDPEDDPPF